MSDSEPVVVLDASAILAWLQDEPGATHVLDILTTKQTCCTAANYSEVMQKAVQHGLDMDEVAHLLDSYDVAIEPVLAIDGMTAAGYWPKMKHLSLGDRLCLAVTFRLDGLVLSADTGWLDTVLPVRAMKLNRSR